MKQVCWAVLIALCCAHSGNAQASGKSPAPGFECGTVMSAFNRSRNETQVQLRPLVLEGVFHIAHGDTLHGESYRPGDDYGVALTAAYTYPGTRPATPQSVLIIVEVESRHPRYEKESSLSLIFDGDAVDLGSVTRTVQRTKMGLTREDLSAPISYEQFVKIRKAKKVKLNLGSRSFTLTDCHADALRKLASAIPS